MYELWFPHGCGSVEYLPFEYDSVEIGIEVRAFRKSVHLPGSGKSRLADISRKWRFYKFTLKWLCCRSSPTKLLYTI